MRKTADAIKRKIEQGQQEQLQQKIPAGAIRDQLPSKTLPPATGTTRGGVLLSDAVPSPTGAAAAGADSDASRADHVHALEMHHASHQHAGSDEVATATPAANAIPKAGAANTIADGWLSAAIARLADLVSVYQPLDSDLTAIAAIATTSYGRGFLPLANDAAARSYIGAGTGSGSVTSVALTAPPELSVGGSPVATSGTLALSWANQSANTGLFGPASGGAAAPAFRALVANDIPNLDSAKITTGEIPRSPLNARGDLLTRDATTHARMAIGAAGRYVRSDGTDPSWHTLDWADLTYSGLTTGQVPRATSATAVAFGALDLANASAVTGVLPAANGGTGVNNSTRTLTISTNGGTLDFSLAAKTLTIPDTGTAALLGLAQTFTANQIVNADLDVRQLLKMRATSGTTGYGIRFGDGTTEYGNFQSLNTGGVSYLFFATNRQYDGTAWQQLNTRVGGAIFVSGDLLEFQTFPASSSVAQQQFTVASTGIANARLGLNVAGTPVLTTRRTGWGTPTGTLSRATFDQSTVTLPLLAQRLAALVTDLLTHGLIGP